MNKDLLTIKNLLSKKDYNLYCNFLIDNQFKKISKLIRHNIRKTLNEKTEYELKTNIINSLITKSNNKIIKLKLHDKKINKDFI